MPLDRRSLVLAGLAPAALSPLSPVQVQKLFFLIDRNLGGLLGGRAFNFEPYNYGPFDKAVYVVLEELEAEGLVERTVDRSWHNFALTPIGLEKGHALLGSLPSKAKDYIVRVNEFVRKVTFTELVSAIYRAYPEMQENSVFQTS